MNCIKCSTDLPQGKLFCPNCGTMNKEQVREVVAETKKEEFEYNKPDINPHLGEKISFGTIALRWKILLSYLLFGEILIFILIKYFNLSKSIFPYILGFSNNLLLPIFDSDYYNLFSLIINQVLITIVTLYLIVNYYKKREEKESNLIIFIVLIKLFPVTDQITGLSNSDSGYFLSGFIGFMIHTIPILYIYADRAALKFLFMLTGKEFQLSEHPDSRNYKLEYLAIREALMKSRKGNFIFGLLLVIYISPFVMLGNDQYEQYQAKLAEEEKQRIADEERRREEKNWGPYMGQKDWYSANEECISIGMRLPTIDELKAANNAGITKSWQKDGKDYWSSTPYDAQEYYLLDVRNGYTYYYFRYSNDSVRCRR